jgi:hypothetical protein
MASRQLRAPIRRRLKRRAGARHDARGVLALARKTLRAPGRGSSTRSSNERFGSRTTQRTERHGLSRCGAFGSACVAVHRSNIREWHPPGPNDRPTLRPLIGSAFCGPDPHCLTLCDPFATYRQVTHSPASTICRCITGALNRLLTFEPSCLPNSRHRSHVHRDAVCSTYVFTVSGTIYR